MSRTTAGLAAMSLIAAVGVAGCEGNVARRAGQAGRSTSAGAHNDADVTFAGRMVLHHQLALRMVSTADFQAKSPAVKKLAAAIKVTEEQELKQLLAWLGSWGAAIPSPRHDEDPAGEVPGTMTEDDWSELGNAKGTKFDRLWLQLMIKQYQGAIELAKTEQSTGSDAKAKAFASRLQATQSTEVAGMQKLLGQLPS
ncbi:DUF305 domain-containing protein [Kribbella sp. NPDC004536]|uniref:DUF305 domain-containing protein n=1 Tax=Kribbella sp. NPDC004536 TaxID=3364106 RepID=UPI0036A5BDE1